MIKKYPGIRLVARHKYQVRARVTDPGSGKERDCKRICHGSLRDALALQERLRAELRGEAAPEHQRMTLGDYARSWLERTAAGIKPQTVNTYQDRLRHILDVLGHTYIDALRPMDVERLQSAKIAAGYAGSYIGSMLRVLRAISRDAQLNEVIQRDFCLGVRLRKRIARYTEEEPNLLTARELARLADMVPDHWTPMFAVMAYTGMRWGEASGLKWDDLDTERHVIMIRRTNYRGWVGEPKTENSRRIVPMPDELWDLLQMHRTRQLAQQHPGLAEGWLFASCAGKPYRGHPMRRHFSTWLARAGITKHLTQHGLRRTFNDLVTRVAKERVARGILGHATAEMTMHYSVVDVEEKRRAQDAVVRLVKRNSTASITTSREDPREAPAERPARVAPKAQQSPPDGRSGRRGERRSGRTLHRSITRGV